MRIVVASGKGGVGKSTLTSSLALLFARDYTFQLVDADVDCPDLYIIFNGAEELSKELRLSKYAEINYSKCTRCMLCYEKCPFNAIDNKLRVDSVFCEGCGLCAHVCPADAIIMKESLTGRLKKLRVSYDFDGAPVHFPFIYGELEPGESSSGRVVDELKKIEEDVQITLMDAAAGVGCPVIASIQGADLVVLVTEPTPSALDDLIRMSDLANHFNVPQLLVINKSTLSDKWRGELHNFANDKGIQILGEIPFDDSVFKALSEAKPIVVTDSPIKENIMKIYSNLLNYIERM